MVRYKPKNSTLERISSLVDSRGLVYCAVGTTWWTVRSEHLNSNEVGLPCDPRGSVLLETAAADFIQRAKDDPAYYGKHGLVAFCAAFHGNLVLDDIRPWSLPSWDNVNEVIDRAVAEANVVLTAVAGGDVGP